MKNTTIYDIANAPARAKLLPCRKAPTIPPMIRHFVGAMICLAVWLLIVLAGALG